MGYSMSGWDGGGARGTRNAAPKGGRKKSLRSRAWTVENSKDDLSELEAFQLEHDKVIEYGGPVNSGGTLLNRVQGGEEPQAVTLSIEIPDFGWHAAYRVARRFRVVPRLEQEQIVKECLA